MLGAGTAAATRNGFNVRRIRHSIRTFPTISSRRPCSARPATRWDRSPRLQACAITTSAKCATSAFGGLFADLTNHVDETTSSDGFSPAPAAELRGFGRDHLQRPGRQGLPARRRQRSVEPAALHARGPRRPSSRSKAPSTTRPCGTTKSGVKSQFGGITFNAAAFYTDIKDLQVTLDAGSCSSRIVFNVPKAHTRASSSSCRAEPVDGLDLSVAGSWVEAEFDFDLAQGGNVIGGIREGNRLPSVPKFQISASATYTWPSIRRRHRGLSCRDRSSMSAAATPSRATRRTIPARFVHDLPFGGQPAGSATTLDLKLPDYQLVNLSAGIDFDNGLDCRRLRQQSVRREPDAVVRPRARRPRPARLPGRAARAPSASPRASASE